MSYAIHGSSTRADGNRSTGKPRSWLVWYLVNILDIYIYLLPQQTLYLVTATLLDACCKAHVIFSVRQPVVGTLQDGYAKDSASMLTDYFKILPENCGQIIYFKKIVKIDGLYSIGTHVCDQHKLNNY